MKRSAMRNPVHHVNRMRGIHSIILGVFSIFAALPLTIQSAVTAIDTTKPAVIPPEIIADWEAQDGITSGQYAAAIDSIIKGLPTKYKSKVTAGTTKEAYLTACHWRRVDRIGYWSDELKRIIFARHYNLGGPTPGYLEDLESDGVTSGIGQFGTATSVSRGSQYTKGAALCLLEMNNFYSKATNLISDTGGVIRDPCVSFDGKRVVFAWSKDNKGYHLFEMPVDTPATIRQLTSDPEGLTVSDFEPCYLPDSNIIFNSSRCFGYISGNININSNLFMINREGKYLRRITYDQFSNFSPVVKEDDGTIMYSRWEANDRNIYTNAPIMTMWPDGTRQIEYFGNQSTWPPMLFQAREIPGSLLLMAVVGSYKSTYAGELAIIDLTISRNGAKPVQLIAPKHTPADTNDYLGVKPLFQNPFPLDVEWFLVSWRPAADSLPTNKYKIYLMDVNGKRELLAWDSAQSVSQPLSLFPKQVPMVTKYQTDYTRTTGEVFLYKAHYGMGVDSTIDSAAHTVRRLRVIALDYRTDLSFGNTGSSEFCMTPVSRWLGARESKRILGEATVEKDGSAAFIIPARTPFYVQLIDSSGYMLQTMRSWATIQPGERFQCLGCHEDKNVSTDQGRLPIAIKAVQLDTFYDISNQYFSFPKLIQPILNEKCITCHNQNHEKGLDLRGDSIWTGDLNDPDNKNANRYWSRSYYNLTDTAKKYVSYIASTSSSEGLRPRSFGSIKSALITRLRGGHSNCTFTNSQMAKLCAWIDLGIPYSGTYTEGMKPEAASLYAQRLERRTKHAQLDSVNVAAFEAAGGYPLSINDRYYGKKPGNVAMSASRINVRYIRTTRQLSITVPTEGTITLIDLRGRTVRSLAVDREAFLKSATVSLRAAFPPGLYIVNFSGKSVSARQLVSLL